MIIKDCVFLVTGGASNNFGKTAVEILLAEGARVVIPDLPTNELNIFGDEKVIFLPINITEEKDIKTLISVIMDKYGKLDGVINCIDYYKCKPIFDFSNYEPHSLEDFTEIITKNILGVFNIIRFTIRILAENTPNKNGHRGIVINMSNIAAFEGTKDACAYSASKAIVMGMSEALVEELSSLNIKIVTVITSNEDKLLPQIGLGGFFEDKFNENVEEYRAFAELVKMIIETPLINATTIRLNRV